VIVRKAFWLLVPAALSALLASVWPDLIRYLKIRQMSYGNGHPEIVPAGGRSSYPHPSGGERTPDGGTRSRASAISESASGA
jgi:hypothetical protein